MKKVKEEVVCQAVISGFQTPNKGWDYHNITEGMKKTFILWMIKKSPWKGCFLNKTAKDVLENNSWVLNPDKGANYLASAAIATRLISEFPLRFLAWYKMVSLGVDGAKAYILCMNARYNEDMRGIIFNPQGGHIPLHTHFDKAYYKKFLSGNPINVGKKFKYGYGYNSVNNIWGQKSYNGVDSDVLMKKIKPRIEVNIKNLDIFNLKAKGAFIFSTDEEILNMCTDVENFIEGLEK